MQMVLRSSYLSQLPDRQFVALPLAVTLSCPIPQRHQSEISGQNGQNYLRQQDIFCDGRTSISELSAQLRPVPSDNCIVPRAITSNHIPSLAVPSTCLQHTTPIFRCGGGRATSPHDLDIGDPHLPVGEAPVDARKTRLYDIVRKTGAKIVRYLYDFGDAWEHVIKLERWFENVDTAGMPLLLEAFGRCPPEDVGDPDDYAAFLAAIADTSHPGHAEVLEWTAAGFDPATVNQAKQERQVSTLARMVAALGTHVTCIKPNPSGPGGIAYVQGAGADTGLDR